VAIHERDETMIEPNFVDIYLVPIVANDDFDTAEASSCRPDLVDGTRFYTKKTNNSKYILEAFMEGFAKLVLNMLRNNDRSSARSFCFVYRWNNGVSGAQGIIMENLLTLSSRTKTTT
jgi:hypothetical protein